MAASRRLIVLLVLLSPAVASATPEHLETFLKTYQAGARLKSAGCAICHTEVPKHNAYGKSINQALSQAKAFELTAALLRSVESIDSDGDGVPTRDEISADFLPGDPKSRPSAAPKNASTNAGAEAAPPTASGTSLLPKHAFHPTLVHFPVALFMFGGALDLLGLWRRRSDVRKAAIWNMTAGAIATALAIPTGFFAASFSGYALEAGSAVVNHLLFAVAATVLMTGLVAWRAKREPEGFAYVALLLLTVALVAWAGHLGGGLVYG